MIELEPGMIVWTDVDDRDFYSIVVRDKGSGGCWCPYEAVDFFRFLGIEIEDTGRWEDGLTAIGCSYRKYRGAMHPLIMEIYYGAFQSTNRAASNLLMR